MNCIIIDDDKLSRMVLEKFIKQTGFLNFLGAYESAVEAIPMVNSSKEEIDLIFLDVEMPEMTGIEFLKSLKDLPQVIITSAKQKYAIDAFEYDVTDYLLKPFSYARLFKAVDKAHNKYKELQNAQPTDGIFIRSSSSLVRIRFDDVLWIEALENYVVINTKTQKHTIHFTMKAIQGKLPVTKFTRVHRSYIVNVSKIDLIEDNSIVMTTEADVKVIPIGKSYRDGLMRDINLVSK